MGVKVNVKEAKVFDKKFEAGAKKAAQKGGDAGAKGKVEGDYTVEMKLLVELDKETTVKATTSWTILQGSALFTRFKQTKKPSATKSVKAGKVSQGDVDDVAEGVAEAELTGIIKALIDFEKMDKKK